MEEEALAVVDGSEDAEVGDEEAWRHRRKNGKLLCGARTRVGGRCQAHAMVNGRCRNHGGLSPIGVNASNVTNGLYSRYLPTHLVERFEDYERRKAELLDGYSDIALLTVRTTELLEQLEGAGSWSRARELALGDSLEALCEYVLEKHDPMPLWVELRKTLEQNRRLKATQIDKLYRNALTEVEAVAFTTTTALFMRRFVEKYVPEGLRSEAHAEVLNWAARTFKRESSVVKAAVNV